MRTLDSPEGPPTGAWRSLTREVERCTRCPLHLGRTHAVVYRGAERPRVVFVGEAPGAEEDRRGRPFVGRSGRLLDAGLRTIGLAPEQYGIVNLVKCRPPGNVFSRSAASACRSYLDRQLALLAPAVVVSLGANALRALDPTAPPMMQAAGTERTLGERRLFPLLHPAATFRSRKNRARWDEDLARLAAQLPRSPDA
jgi:uracil-DNA glycosylase family 4